MNNVIEVLTETNEILLKCPRCSETFSPKKASLFDVRENYPKRIQKYLLDSIKKASDENKNVNAKIEARSHKISELKQEQKLLKEKIRQKPKRIKTITKHVNIGQILEKILPASKKFEYDPADCRSMFDPIDYVSFNGLTKKKIIESISFIEIKTGGASLQNNQKDIKTKIEENHTKFLEY